MRKIIFLFLLINFNNSALGSIKDNIINNLKTTQNLNFDFEQNINGKIETGNCTIEYPKKIFCKYNKFKKKVLISNGKSLLITTKNGSNYIYAIKSTPLNYILDKNFLIKEIQGLEERIIDDKFVNFTILKNKNEINIFFDKIDFELIGWQTLDINQKLTITYLSSLKKNQKLKNDIFKLPPLN